MGGTRAAAAAAAARGGAAASNTADGGGKRVPETTTRAGTEIYAAELDTTDDARATADAVKGSRASLRGARRSLHTFTQHNKKTSSSSTSPSSSPRRQQNAAGGKKVSARGRGPGVDHYAAMQMDAVRQGWPLAKLMEALPELPSPPEKMGMTSCAAHLQLYDTLVEAGRLHNALELLRALKSAGLHTVGMNVSNKAFLRECARRGAVAVAFEFVEFVDYPDIRLYNMLLSVCAAACDSRSGFAALVLMYDAGVAPDCRAYTTLISACSKSGELDKAFETFR